VNATAEDDALFLLAPFIWLHVLLLILVAGSICTPVIAVLLTVRYLAARKRRRRPLIPGQNTGGNVK
jgi:hypothetical protein